MQLTTIHRVRTYNLSQLHHHVVMKSLNLPKSTQNGWVLDKNWNSITWVLNSEFFFLSVFAKMQLSNGVFTYLPGFFSGKYRDYRVSLSMIKVQIHFRKFSTVTAHAVRGNFPFRGKIFWSVFCTLRLHTIIIY